jgi:hypothetical protein
MSFLITHYYLIEPTPLLITRLQSALEEFFASMLLERIVVAKSHQSSLSIELEQANITEIKLAFLARLLIDRVWDFATQFEDLFGSPDLSVTLFDRWWTLSEIEYESFSDWEGFVTQAREQSNNANNPK